jgi:hypothetical protein
MTQGIIHTPIMQYASLWSRRRWLQAALAASACKVAAADSGVPQVRILFLGNSYTAFNGLPAIVGELLLSTGMLAPHIGSYTQGSYKLDLHAGDPAALALLKKGADDGKPWDVLVVQEQSVISSIAAVNPEAQQYMSGGLSKLVALARQVNPQMLIVDFQVWARHESLWKKKSEDALTTGANPAEAQARIRHANAVAVKAALEAKPERTVQTNMELASKKPPTSSPIVTSSTSSPLPVVEDVPTKPIRSGVLRFVGLTALRLHHEYPGERTSDEVGAENGRCLNFTRRKEVQVTLLDGRQHVIYFYDILRYRGLWLHDHNPDSPDTSLFSVKSEP